MELLRAMLQALPQDAWLRWAVIMALALTGVAAIMMSQVLLLSDAASRREQRRLAFERRWLPRLAAVSLGGSVADVAPPAPRDRVRFLRTWCQMQYRLRGAAHARLNAMLDAFGLGATAVGLVRHRNGSTQLLGLACLRHLGDAVHWDTLEAMTRDPRPIQSLAAAEALVATDHVRAMALLVPLAAERRDWAGARVSVLCRLAGRAAVTGPLLDTLRVPLRPGARERLLRLLPLGDTRAIAPWARDILDAPDATAPEAVAALEVLAQVLDPRDRSRVTARLAAGHPEVRAAAVRAFAGLATTDDLASLAPMLVDRDWSVRQDVADAIVALPGIEARAVAAVRDATTDPYGRDALDRAIGERVA